MPAWILTLALLALPLPGVPALGPGAEIRVTTPDLRVVYLAIRVTEQGIVARPARPLVPGQPVAVVVRVGRRVEVFPGRAGEGDVVLFLPQGRASLLRTLREVYGLRWPKEVPLGPRPLDRRRP